MMDKKARILIIIFAVLCTLLALEAAVYKLVLPSMGLPKITFSGARTLTDADLSAALDKMKDTGWFTFNPEEAVSLLSEIPAVDSVTVTKRFPDKITILITERECVASMFITNSEGRSVSVAVDKSGMLFADSEVHLSVPIISGIPVENLSSGMRIPSRYRPLIDQIAHIEAMQKNYFAALSEICVVPKENNNYELMLIPSNAKTKVIIDRVLNEEALEYMMIVLDVIKEVAPDAQVIDLRYGSISFS